MLKFCRVALCRQQQKQRHRQQQKEQQQSDNNSAMSFANSSSILDLFLLFVLLLFLANIVAVWRLSSCCCNSGASFGFVFAPCCALRFPFAFYALFIVAASSPTPFTLLPRPFPLRCTTMWCLSDKQIRVAAAPRDVWVIYVYGALASTKKLCIRHVARHLNVHLIT